jgi:hypothetical protein
MKHQPERQVSGIKWVLNEWSLGSLFLTLDNGILLNLWVPKAERDSQVGQEWKDDQKWKRRGVEFETSIPLCYLLPLTQAIYLASICKIRTQTRGTNPLFSELVICAHWHHSRYLKFNWSNDLQRSTFRLQGIFTCITLFDLHTHTRNVQNW